MAGLTKEQREQRAQEKADALRAEIEIKIRAEYEEKLNKQIADSEENVLENKVEIAKRIQKMTRIPLDTVVPVICNTVGGAVYVSKKIMGYMVEWDDIGSVEYMELGELASMRNTDRRFFEDNWIIFENTEEYSTVQLYDFLKVTKHYKNIVTPDTIDDLLKYDKNKLAKTIATFSKGMKQTVAAVAKSRLNQGTLDKNIIDTLESALGVQFNI